MLAADGIDHLLARPPRLRRIDVTAIDQLRLEELDRVMDNVAAQHGAAAAAVTQAPDELDELASVVKAYCSDAGPRAVETLIQTLGGIGFTWEHPAHLYLRRAKTLEFLFGDAAFHRDRLARRLGLVA